MSTPTDAVDPNDAFSVSEAELSDVYQTISALVARDVPPRDQRDVAHDAVIHYLPLRPAYDPGGAIHYGVVRAVSNYWKSARRQSRLIEKLGSRSEVAIETPDVVGRMDLRRGLALLSLRERQALMRHDGYGEPWAAIADDLGCTEDAAKNLGSRARKKMRKYLSVALVLILAVIGVTLNVVLRSSTNGLKPTETPPRPPTGTERRQAQAQVPGVLSPTPSTASAALPLGGTTVSLPTVPCVREPLDDLRNRSTDPGVTGGIFTSFSLDVGRLRLDGGRASLTARLFNPDYLRTLEFTPTTPARLVADASGMRLEAKSLALPASLTLLPRTARTLTFAVTLARCAGVSRRASGDRVEMVAAFGWRASNGATGTIVSEPAEAFVADGWLNVLTSYTALQERSPYDEACQTATRGPAEGTTAMPNEQPVVTYQDLPSGVSKKVTLRTSIAQGSVVVQGTLNLSNTTEFAISLRVAPHAYIYNENTLGAWYTPDEPITAWQEILPGETVAVPFVLRTNICRSGELGAAIPTGQYRVMVGVSHLLPAPDLTDPRQQPTDSVLLTVQP